MKRVLVAGTAVAVGDGSLLGIAMALGWTPVVAAAAVAGLVGAVLVALATPPPRAAVAPTVTLGLPVREATADSPDVAEPDRQPELVPTPTASNEPAPVAA